ncbi:class II aminotransferase/8-amino-7-oxononanoate synthase [Hypoxylon sp. FL0890]|nr:class II aminotransferase/8-amino-7-oxononanoate synthase [Hypoxylon sp. FL0890]
MASVDLLASLRLDDNKPKAPALHGAPVFYRNLEQVLDQRRADGSIYRIPKGIVSEEGVTDLVTMDLLSLTKSGKMRTLFLEEAKHPEFRLNMGATRLMSGNPYLSETEDEVAALHGAEAALLFRSGWDANTAIMVSIPRPGDVILFDELVHASLHDGMQLSLASTKQAFKHNDVDAFREALMHIKEREQLIRDGSRCVLIVVESEYSMEGDITPLAELVSVAKEIFPDGNAQFIIDEAHSTGVLGKDGKGLVSELGLEKEIAIRMHSFTKAMACAGGAAVLCNETVRSMMINFARILIYSHSPEFSIVASVRVACNLMKTGQIEPLRLQLQRVIRKFYDTITSNEVFDEAVEAGLLSIPAAADYESKEYLSHISYLMTRQRYNQYLYYHLQLRGFKVLAVDYPIVPKGQNRIRLVFKAHITDAQIEAFVEAVTEWAQEMLEIEASPRGGDKIPSATRHVYAMRDKLLGATGVANGASNGDFS